LTGIDEVVTSPDLLDRTISLTLTPPNPKKTEAVFWASFYEAQPTILGALYTTIGKTLRALPAVRKEPLDLPRMADFFLLAHAVAKACEWEQDRFATAYSTTRVDARDVALEANSVYAVFIQWLDNPRTNNPWQGNMNALLDELNRERVSAYAGDHAPLPPRNWPTTARGLQSALNGITSYLRQTGIDLDFIPHGRQYRITDGRDPQERLMQRTYKGTPYTQARQSVLN
jgi:hypothetical protein